MRIVTADDMKAKESIFLNALAEGLPLVKACRAAGLDTGYVYQRKANDKDFAAAWQAAYDQVTDFIEYCAIQRATEGYQDPVYHRGQVVGHRPVYSDALAAFLLKGRRPAVYRDRSSLDVGGTVTLESLVNASFKGSEADPPSAIEHGQVIDNAGNPAEG